MKLLLFEDLFLIRRIEYKKINVENNIENKENQIGFKVTINNNPTLFTTEVPNLYFPMD